MREEEAYAQMGGYGGEGIHSSIDKLCSIFGGHDQ